MCTLSISPDDYEIMLRKMVKGILEEENILLSLQRRPGSYGVDFSDFNDVDKLYVERVKYYFSSLYPYSREIILSSSKSISEECFFGQGRRLINILERQGRFSSLKKEDDLWTGLENFWIRNDWHKNSSPHQISDAYFLFDVKNIDWRHFFSNYSVAGALGNLKKNVESLSLLGKIRLDIKGNMDLISLNFFNRWMVASKPILIRLLLISEAFYAKGEGGCKNIGDIAAHDFIFGEMEYALSACNFQNEKFHVSDIIRKILVDFSVDHIVF